MRTTVDLPDHLLVAAKQVAAERRTSLARVLEEGLRRFLADDRAPKSADDVSPLPVDRRAKLRRGIDIDDTSALLELD